MPSFDLILAGGGIMGLSLAHDLAGHGWHVCLIEQGAIGREASWAGAGIVPPGSWYSPHPALESLASISAQQYPQLSEQLRAETGIENGWRRCGGIYVTGGPATRGDRELAGACVAARLERWRALGIEVQALDRDALRATGVRLCDSPGDSADHELTAWLVPAEGQIRNPRHLAALATACRQRGVVIMADTQLRGLEQAGRRVHTVVTNHARLTAARVCLTTGCWTGGVTAALGFEIGIRPVRGQMVLFRLTTAQPFPTANIHYDGRYLVARDDGRVLVGSTVEEAGFDKSTTADAIDGLVGYARQFGLSSAQRESSWAGLRPMASDGLPVLGQLPELDNVWISAGHGRSGLQFAPATTMVVSALLRDCRPPIDIRPFSPTRFATTQAT